MDRLRIQGGIKLEGTVQVSGAKNAALPILISSLLAQEKGLFENVPDLQDIHLTLQILESLGCAIKPQFSDVNLRHSVWIVAPQASSALAPYDLVSKMRASVLVLGPLLARYGRAKVSLPGGCAIGARPIDFHLRALEKLGAKIELQEGYVIAECKRLQGAHIRFDFPSVGATENILMAATLANGETLLENCAREPEIVDLAHALIQMGAQIEGAGTSTLRVQGKSALPGLKNQPYAIMGDRIEAGTYLLAGLITGGNVRVEGIDPSTLQTVLEKMREAGAQVTTGENWISARAQGRPQACSIQTLPYPGFPTDMQAQWSAWMSVAQGTSILSETIFENRFMHVPELVRMGAEMAVRGNRLSVNGVDHLHGAPVMATDLRASASLALAALAAKGETWIQRIYHLDRGYEKMELKLGAIGAHVQRA